MTRRSLFDSTETTSPWWLIAPALALAVLGAHYYRGQAWVGVAGCAALLVAMLALPRPGVARLVQAALVFATAEWAWTAWALAQQRMALGQPWKRMLAILVVVALLTAASALAFETRALRRRFRLRGASSGLS